MIIRTATALILVCLGLGCKGLSPATQRVMTDSERTRLLARTFSPEELGITLVESAGKKSVRWKEYTVTFEPTATKLLRDESGVLTSPTVSASVNNGRVFPMVIDTGSPITMIHYRQAGASGVRLADPALLNLSFRGPAGGEQTLFALADQVNLGSFEFRNVFTAVRTETYERRRDGNSPAIRWEGNVIGLSSLFRLSYFTVDYLAESAVLSATNLFKEPDDDTFAAAMPFEMQGWQLLVEIRLGDSEPITTIIDTGNDAVLMAPNSVIQALGYGEQAAHGKPSLYVGLGGEIAMRSFTLPTAEIGGQEYHQLEVVVAPDDYPITVGNGFLRRFKATFDFKRKMLWLEKPPIARTASVPQGDSPQAN